MGLVRYLAAFLFIIAVPVALVTTTVRVVVNEPRLYEYATDELRQADSATILPTGGFEAGHFDLIYGRVMFWARGRIIVNYNLGDPHYWSVLIAELGEPLTPASIAVGDPPDPMPPSELCS